MLKKFFEGGKLVYDLPDIEEIRKYCKQEMFYGENYSSYEKLIEDIKEYIKWYNTKRIKECILLIIDYIPLNNLFNCPCFWVQLSLLSLYIFYYLTNTPFESKV